MVPNVCENQLQRFFNLPKNTIIKPDDDKSGFFRRAKLGSD